MIKAITIVTNTNNQKLNPSAQLQLLEYLLIIKCFIILTNIFMSRILFTRVNSVAYSTYSLRSCDFVKFYLYYVFMNKIYIQNENEENVHVNTRCPHKIFIPFKLDDYVYHSLII